MPTGRAIRARRDSSAVPLKKRLGAYYTPEPVARLLVQWALQGLPGRVLDPSFGGCNFLRTSVAVLHQLGAEDAGPLVHGVDVDESVRVYANELATLGVPSYNLITDDFFRCKPGEEGLGLFNALVGNPPYIRHHWFQGSMRARAVEATERANVKISLQADAWAYFVIHSTRFLEVGGRLAFLLPGALLQAQYARPVLQALEKQFAGVWTIRLEERLFPDAQEETVLLLAWGKGEGPGRRKLDDAPTVRDLESLLAQNIADFEHLGATYSSWKEAKLPDQARHLWGELQQRQDVDTLGSLAKLRIGVVTGANDFFVRSAAEKASLESQGVRLTPVVSRARWLRTLRWMPADQASIDSKTRASRLLEIDPGTPLSGELAYVIRTAEQQGLHEGYKCSKRAPWYSLTDAVQPDAFLQYMGANPPRLTLNGTGGTCTNAIHRVWWEDVDFPREAIAVGMWTSLFSVGSEILGRSYGGGILKLEPGAAACVPVPVVPGAERWFGDLDRLVRKGATGDAVALADRVVLGELIGLGESEVRSLREGARMLAKLRAGKRATS